MSFKWHPDDPPPPIEAHSRAKLTVLRSYLHAYFDRLNVNPNREEFKLDLVDGFAGGGAFRDSDGIVSGTPLIMLEESDAAKERLNLNRTKPLRFDCKFYFVDVEAAHTDHLRKVLTERGYGYRVDDGEVVVRNGSFQGEIDGILKEIRQRQPRAGRAIFLLDQTGFSQVSLDLIRRIFNELAAAEIILTFAADALVNHLTQTPTLIKAVAPIELTDSQIHDLIRHREGDGGRALIQRTLRDQIRTRTGATYDTPFFIKPRLSRRALWFLHLSRHPTARDVMIQCHWNIQNTFEHYGRGDFGMLGWDALRPQTFQLFHFEQLESRQLQKQLLDSMPAKLFSLASEEPVIVDVMRHILANQTAARFLDLDQAILTLAQEKEILILNSDGKVRSSNLKRLHADDRITFPETLLLPGISRRQKP